MNMVSAGYIPGDPRLIEQIVYELKSQGIFDQFRKECIADVDTKPAYQNLRQRVEGSVNNFLMKQKFSGDMNKNQIREQLRKNISESGFLETGVERIVDQVVNPKINTVFLPKVEDVVYRYLGLEIPNRDCRKEELKVDVTDLLPNDLEAVSPESVHDQSLNVSSDNKQVNTELNENSLNSSNTKTEEDESPAFELLEENTKFSLHDENSVDLNSSEKAVSSNEKLMIVENSQDISQSSKNSFDSHLSIETSVESLKMEICNDKIISEEKMVVEESKSENQDMKVTEDTIDAFNKKIEDRKNVESKVPEDKSNDVKKSDDKSKSRSDRDKKEDKDKRSRSKSESKSKSHKDYRSSSKHSSSRDKDKERKDYRNGKEKDDSEKNKQENKNKEGDTKSQRSKDRNDKDDKLLKSSKDKDKSQRDKDKSKSDKDRSKHSSSSSKHSKSSSSSSKKDSSYKEKEKSDEKVNDKESSTSKNKDVSSKEKDDLKTFKDKDKPRLSSSSSRDKEKDKHHNDLKSRSSDKYKKSSDKSKSYHDKKSSSKKEKDKKSVDDHYSSKEKRNDRRSTDRDSNDGSSKSSRHDSFTDIQLQANKSSSKESSEVFSSGSGESNNSDAIEATKFQQNPQVSVDKKSEVLQSIKYIKPKFASNIHEAMKIMKIRKQLAKLERNNQLSLSNIQTTSDDKTVPYNSAQASTKLSESLNNETKTEKSSDVQALKSRDLSTIDSTKRNSESLRNETKTEKSLSDVQTQESKALSIESRKCNSETLINETKTETASEVQTLKSKDLSMESFEALEARLAQEMSNVDYHMYGDEDDNFECSSVSISPAKKKKDDEPSKLSATDIIFDDIGSISNINSNVEIGEEIELLSQHDNNITENIDKTESMKPANTENVTQESQTLNPTVSVDTKNNLSDKLLSKDTENKGAIECISIYKESVTPKENKLKDAQKSTTFIDDIQKNGKKCFIKIDRMDLLCSKNSKSNNINQKSLENNSLLNNIHNSIKGTSNIHNNSTKNADIKEDNIFKGEDENAPCYYFEECNSEYKKNISNMDKIIKGLEMVIQKRTLEIHNNIPTLPKRGRKRKAPNTENNNKTPYIIHQSDLRNKPLHETRKVEIKEAIYGSDVSHNQNFSLPLSPAESDKSGEIKKEESITVKTKRTGRVSVGRANERYSNEDLYKPRPVFNYTSSRRRGRTE